MASIQQLVRRIRFGDPIVVVSGLPRSGTSMAMKMLEAGGVQVLTDGLREADVDNPKGYYEFEPVKDLAETDDKSWLHDARGQAVKIISFLLKELPPEHNYRVVFMRRNLDEILASQSKMLDNRGESNETDDLTMADIWESHLWRVNYLMKNQPQFDFIYVPYRDALQKPRPYAERINTFLGGRLDVERMVGVVDKNLYRNRSEGTA